MRDYSTRTQHIHAGAYCDRQGLWWAAGFVRAHGLSPGAHDVALAMPMRTEAEARDRASRWLSKVHPTATPDAPALPTHQQKEPS
ncbi:hypothetical protein [Uliginosibacterium sp. H1]|uniref:hypothetical protein n=1 Tax=Uliginosibacterium sp. H1 TaxID=3114757 RepID=UPI002E19991D|nr:hypothetical protein [Uliginosibacterium sp. H1]